MTQTVQLDVINSNTGVAFGSTVYQLDGTTVYSAFSTSGWSEAPAGSGAWHNSALTLPDAGGVVAYGVSGTEYNRATFGPALLAASNYTAPPTVTAIRTEMDSNSTKLANLDATITSRAPASTALSTAQWTNTRAGNLDNLDAAVSSRSTFAGGAVASVTGTVGSVASGVTVATNNDKTGYALSSAGIQAIWDTLTSALTTLGSIGKLLVTNLDAAVSSRLATASYTAPTTPPTVTAIRTEIDSNSTKLANLDAAVSTRAPSSTALSTAQWTNGRAANLDNLDTTVSSRLSTAGYTAPTTPPTVTQIRTEMDNNSTKLANLDAAVTTRSTPANVTSAQTAIITAIDALDSITANDVVQALAAYSVETGKSFDTVMKEIYAILRGKYIANAENPTQLDFYAPDGTTIRVTQSLTDTTRTPS